ncbi:MAG: Fe-S protein assembly co-chaperone HscB [Proteobacteria bacterium]|jgi:molecular chaperone HscB|nr:Fe-S protein assembly co-chaperone HscB [Pseudomonadota bacterium]MDA0896428.1 Fe-S protein assembly co-chaperone HscB [Pseudomonadota bacterium]MDA1245048.1 Fe-S protein assembly co-chaperone HscB [Pseudomonadota bacterium]MDP4783543.1 Fe-S protein assembly co-chaperone HscB [Gammaproteobacteria bacterium]
MQVPEDYFSLFSLERRFAIDKNALAANFRALQNENHPDRVAADDEQAKLLAVQKSSLLNDAYATLKSPLARAGYLLTLQGVDVEGVSQDDLDMAVLMEQMELREKVVEAPAGEAGLAVLLPIKRDIQSRIAAREQRFVANLEGDDLSSAKRVFHELQFLHKLFQEIEVNEEKRLGY